MSIIHSGYRLTVKSWENDADNYNTVVLTGLSKDDMLFYACILKAFEHTQDYKNRLCNLYDPSDEEMARLSKFSRELFARFPAMLEGFDPEFTDMSDDDNAHDCLLEVLCDLGLSGTEFHTRVVASWSVEYIPEEVKFEDVTEQFK